MIVDFSVQNFRSIRTEQLFSFTAEKQGHLSENIAYPGGSDKFGVLKVAALYGANAAGKSNILRAFTAIKWLVIDSGDLKEGDEIPPFEPYMLNDESRQHPVTFEIEFFAGDGNRYRYHISFLEGEIVSEVLDFFPSRQKANLFTRNRGDTWETISFGKSYKGKTKRIPFFKNNSYLSKIGGSAASSELMAVVYNYFKIGFLPFLSLNANLTLASYFNSDNRVGKIGDILCGIDTGVVKVSKYIEEDVKMDDIPSDIPEHIRKAIYDSSRYKFSFWHSDNKGELIEFDEELESQGTRRLFTLLPLIFETLKRGSTLILDELEASLHPHVAELIIRVFNDPDANKKNAQLIFTTHDVMLMNSQNLRRDQLWFVAKEDGETKLYSLDEYDKKKVTPTSPFGHWYSQGRFGALPRISYKKILSALWADEEEVLAGDVDA